MSMNKLVEVTQPQLTEEEAINQLKESYLKIISILKRYVELKEEYYSIIALWIIGTYCNDTFNTFPYLFINAMRGSGKTRLLKLLAALCRNGEIQANISEAVLFRTAKRGTIIIDEFEHIGGKEKGILRELLNAGYKKGISVKRMRKVIKQGTEDHEVVKFDLFTPIVMANIFGMDEVLSDRCITLILEKSSSGNVTRKIEDFETNKEILELKRTLEAIQCSLCSVVTLKNNIERWNNYIDNKNITTPNYTYTYTTPNNITALEEEFFDEVYNSNIDGRNLEIFFPLFILSNILSKELFQDFLNISKDMVIEKKHEEYTESKDVLIYSFVGYKMPLSWYSSYVSIADFTTKFKEFIGSPEDEIDWLNTKWVGRALRRLNLIVQKRRLARGIEVMLDDKKAKGKMVIFSEKRYDGPERRVTSVPVEIERRKA